MGHYVYILQAADGRYYVGYTTDLARRMRQHRAGTGAKFLRSFGVQRLLHHEVFPTKSQALRREAAIKRLTRAEKAALARHDTV